MMEKSSSKQKKPAIKQAWLRVLLFILALLVATGFFQVLGFIIILAFNVELDFFNIQTILYEPEYINFLLVFKLLEVVGAFFAVWIFRKYLDNRSIKSLGFSLKNKGKDAFWGFVFGILLISLGFFSLNFSNLLEVTAITANAKTIIGGFAFFVLVAFHEEVVFRGYILNNLMTSMNKYLALSISAIIFALVHGMNPNITILAFINLVLAGLVLGASYIHTKNLWFPIMLHLSWNYFLGPIYGFEVSGLTLETLVHHDVSGNELITGGKFGFEGSIILTFLLVTGFFAIDRFYSNYSKKTGG